jgi:hypothetical protein
MALGDNVATHGIEAELTRLGAFAAAGRSGRAKRNPTYRLPRPNHQDQSPALQNDGQWNAVKLLANLPSHA